MALSVFTVSATSGVTQPASGVDLGLDGWDRISIIYPSAPSGNLGMLVSDSLTGTYYRYAPVAAASAPVLVIGSVDSSLAANGVCAQYPGGYRFIKPYNTSGTTNATNTFKIICSRT